MMPDSTYTKFAHKADAIGLKIDSLEFAKSLDEEDPLKELRSEFHLPKRNGREMVYLLGNSLGLQPKCVKKLLEEELGVWAHHANEGHFNHEYGRPWLTVDEECANLLLPLVGATDGEVAAMGTLTANLHLLMCAFYRPTANRYKIVLEDKAFPSDYVHKSKEAQL